MEAYRQDCLPAIQNCPKTGGDLACVNANQVCLNTIQSPISNEADFNVYNIRCPSGKGGPPSTYKSYLQNEDVMKKIGAKSSYVECSSLVGRHFQSTGDSKCYRAQHYGTKLTRATRLTHIPPRALQGSPERNHRSGLGRRRRLDLQLEGERVCSRGHLIRGAAGAAE